MLGKVGSLNVSASAAIVLYEALRQRGRVLSSLGRGGGYVTVAETYFPLNGGLEEFSRIGDSDFFHHIGPMGLDRLHADF